ncbi:type II secretion system protein GspJ [Pseudomonas sp. MAG733B]|uniref:type II secretion system protein GspJ n=1 Tax=Pseudomonas sp. MAG733B TaxID=3122079 RepID=UPI0030D4914E
MNRQTGFTLLELVIAIAIFALLGLASWTLFEGVMRVQQGSMAHEREFRNLQRAIAVVERDLLQITEQALVLEQAQLQWQRGNWRNPLDLPRSERQTLTYRLDNGVLWRDSRAEGSPIVQRQKLLDDVRDLRWRLFDGRTGWRSDSPTGQNTQAPLAVEMQLSAGRYQAIRRVILLPGALL